MTPEDLRALAQEARRRTIGPFAVLLPTQLEVSVRAVAVPPDDPAADRAFEEAVAVDAVEGWTLTLADLAPGQPLDVLPFDKALLPVVFEERPDFRRLLLNGVWGALEARRLTFEADRKN
jgi:hypothetical protein